MSIPSIDGPSGLTVFIGYPITFPADSYKYDKAVNILGDPRLPVEDKKLFLEELEAEDPIKSIPVEQGFTHHDENVYYNGKKLHGCLKEKIKSMLNAGIKDFTSLTNFMKNLSANPSHQAAEELYDFLSYKELPITEDGYFLAYKGVSNNYFSKHGNTQTRVLQGIVENGYISNQVGDVIRIERQDVDDDRTRSCAQGVHVGSLHYALSWGEKTMVVKVHPKDVVSVPQDCSCQKMRTCGYEVIAEYTQEIVAPVVKVKQEEIVGVSSRSDILRKVTNYLENKSRNRVEYVRARQIQSAFSPQCPSLQAIFKALDTLYVEYDLDNQAPSQSLVKVP